MTLSSYINDLLYRYDCVIVPNFGGFVSNAISARMNEFTHTFYPPTKQITFNAHLKNNDGLLANYIASSKNISFNAANSFILSEVRNWKRQLESESLLINKVGSLTLNKEKQLIFTPDTVSNYLLETFGMTAVTSPEIKREVYVAQTNKTAKVLAHKRPTRFLKYAATAAILLTVGTIGWNGYQDNQLKAQQAKQLQDVEKKIESATFVINNPLPTIQLNIEKEAPKKYHIIAGAFEFPINAEKKLKQLKAKGFKAHILGKNAYGLTQVAYESFSSRTVALKRLEEIRVIDSKDAWFLPKKIQ